MSLEHWLIIKLKKVFMEKETKINVLTVFFISYKNFLQLDY